MKEYQGNNEFVSRLLKLGFQRKPQDQYDEDYDYIRFYLPKRNNLDLAIKHVNTNIWKIFVWSSYPHFLDTYYNGYGEEKTLNNEKLRSIMFVIHLSNRSSFMRYANDTIPIDRVGEYVKKLKDLLSEEKKWSNRKRTIKALEKRISQFENFRI